MATLAPLLRSILSHNRELVRELARREVAERYAGTALGSVWAVVTPLLTMGIYVGLFGFVFPTRFGGDGSPWLAVADCATRAPGMLLSHRALVRQVVFPVEVLPAKSVLATLVPQVVGTVVGLAIALLSAGPSPMLALLPVLWIAQLALMLGLMLLLATLGVWIRDLREVVSFLANVGLYIAPILLLPQVIDALPRAAAWLIAANPFSHMVWCFHDAVVHQRFAHPWSWLIFPLFALAVLAAGARLFTRLKPAMGEAL